MVVNWALGRIAAQPEVARRAASALDRCVESLEATEWPGALSCFSGLNGDGFPFEFAFSSRDEQVRFTAEAAPPEVHSEQRLSLAGMLLEALGAEPLPAEVRQEIARLQGEGQLVWGSAVGARHGPSGDHFKLYAEVPSRVSNMPDPVFRAARLQRSPIMVMVGWETRSNRLERYFRSDGLVPGELQRIVAAAGFEERTRELVNAVEAAWQGSADGALAGKWGLSLAGPVDGSCEALSLFKEANRMQGGDARTRSSLLNLVKQLGVGRLEAYERISAPFYGREGSGAHGMLAMTICRGRPLELRIGISPAAAFHAARAGGEEYGA
jgi:hypothetical protein